MSSPIFVYAHWESLDNPVLFGTLFVDSGRTGEIISFSYDEKWLLHSGNQIALDPDLQLFRGRQYPKQGDSLSGLFLDSSPDRWGRMLMQRRELIVSKKEKRASKRLQESDYLLGVHDIARMGALRFKREKTGDFLRSDSFLASPPWTRLRELEHGCSQLENATTLDEQEYWISQLNAPGSSLGGARPKATVQDEEGHLWIAKFPSKHDVCDSGGWEMIVHDLAYKSGIEVPEAFLDRFSPRGSTFLTRRFDRTETNKRIHFSSAMALLGKKDGENETSYLELVEFLLNYGANPTEDLSQLWKRIVFNIAVSNTDDHLRNHGFLLGETGWRLSPAYDLNASIEKTGLHLAIDDVDHSLDFQVALKVAPQFRLSRKTAIEILRDVTKVIREWKSVARKYDLPEDQCDFMQGAFRTFEE